MISPKDPSPNPLIVPEMTPPAVVAVSMPQTVSNGLNLEIKLLFKEKKNAHITLCRDKS